MRKLLLFSIAIIVFTGSLQAQMPYLKVESAAFNPQNSYQTIQNNTSSNFLINGGDTLRYFLNKHYYRNSNVGTPTPNTQYFTLLNPYPNNTLTINYCGSVFLNTSTISVNGLEGIVTRRANSVSANIPLKLYLCNVNALNLPIFPPLDSVLTTATSTNNGAWIGGNFNAPQIITGKFAVLFKNASTVPGDTLGMFINNACTPTSTCPANQRYGESLSVFRINGNFQLTTNSFGTGTDYEFIVAPRITFNYSSGISVNTPTICANSVGSFSNTTSPMSLVENRQFNFNKFASVWGAFSNTLLPITDSIYNWAFTGSSTGPLTTKNANALFNVIGNQTASLTVKYNKSRAGGLLPSISDIATAIINVSSTNAPSLSITGSSLICSGSTVTLTASGNPTYTWTNPVSNNPVIVVTPNATTIYTVTGVNGACVGYQTFTVNVVSTPSVLVTGPASACIGSTLVLNASGATTYSWSTGSTSYSTAISASVAGVQAYTVVGQVATCPPGTTIKTVTVNALPVVTLSSPVTTLCTTATGGTTVQLTGSPSGGIYSGSILSSGVFVPLAAAVYTQTYSYTNTATGCANSATNSISVFTCQVAVGLYEILSPQDISVFPNPSSNGLFQLKNPEGLNTISVYDVLGVLITKQMSDEPQFMLDLSGKAQGCYFVRITNAQGFEKTVRIIYRVN